jgi:tetratricopeptide (TPR) repeat protein
MSRITALSARIVVACILAAPCAASLGAQRLGPEVPRPRGAVADTNDAQAYFDYGVRRFETDPEAAAAAFYWSARINPASADAWYARRAALLMKDEGLRRTFVNGGRHARDSKQLRALDSLYLRALNLNPLLYRRFDKRLLISSITQEMLREVQRGGNNVTPGEVDYAITTWLQQAGPEFRAWVAYGDGNFDEALRLYASVEKSSKFKAGVRIERGRVLGMRGEADSAVAQLQLALTEMRSRDTKDLVYFYDSKALFEHTIGILLEQQSDYAGARDAYGRALQEDLAFYPAHQRLGLLALGMHDTTTALSELDLAVQIAGDEPFLRYLYGWALAAAGKFQESSDQLKKAVELEPYFALPHVTLGQIYEQLHDGKNAQAAYTAYLARASQNDPRRELATTRLREVTEILDSTPRKP